MKTFNVTVQHHPRLLSVLAGDMTAVDATFRTLIFPLGPDDALPHTTWTGSNKNDLEVRKPDGSRDVLAFRRDSENEYPRVTISKDTYRS